MQYYLHAYTLDTETGEEKPLDAKDPRAVVSSSAPTAAGAQSAAGVPGKGVAYGLSKDIIKAEIVKMLEQFPLPLEPTKASEFRTEISDLQTWKALLDSLKVVPGNSKAHKAAALKLSFQRKGGEIGVHSGNYIISGKHKIVDFDISNIDKRIVEIRSKIISTITKLYADFIPFENGELCIVHSRGKLDKLPRRGMRLYRDDSIKSSLEKDIGVIRRRVVTWDLLCFLNEFMAEVYYKITLDEKGQQPFNVNVVRDDPGAGAAASGNAAAPSSAVKQETENALTSLKRVSILTEKADYLQQEKTEYDADLTFIGTKQRGWKNIFKYSRLEENVAISIDKDKVPEGINHFFNYEDDKGASPLETLPVLWIPNELPGYFYEEARNGTYIKKEKNVWWRENFASGQGKPDSCVYGLQNGDLVPFLYIAQAAPSPGGGGGMRSDNPSEAEYWWLAKDEPSRLFALSLGLSNKRQDGKEPADGNFVEVPLPKAPKSKTLIADSMDSEIRYWKKFGDVPSNSKKNEPKESKPLQRKTTKIDRDDLKKLYTKKQKGAWTNGRKGPQPISGSVGDRESAGQVMQDALKTLGVFPAETLPSATAFAKQVVSSGNTAQAWVTFSEGVTPLKGKGSADLKAEALRLMATIRTDQEWCHLLGHGDGGEEYFENFISGSKHCNTEQLAIETGQRTGRVTYASKDSKSAGVIDLAVKVTGYLFSEDKIGVKRIAFSSAETELLKSYALYDGKVGVALEKVQKVVDDYKKYKGELQKTAAAGNVAKDPVEKLLGKNSKPSIDHWKTAEAATKRGGAKGDDDTVKYNAVSESVIETLEGIAALPLPLGKYVRYKVFFKKEKEYIKIFDHTFEAQKESFDFFEYKIIESTVRRTIAIAAEREDTYRAAIKLKAERLNPPDEKIPPPGKLKVVTGPAENE